MTRRHWAIVVIVLLLVFFGLVLWQRGPQPCRATFEQVTVGMSRDEVIGTVGGSPRTYRSDGSKLIEFRPENQRSEHWLADDGHLAMIFGDDGRAEYVKVWDARPSQSTNLQRFFSQLGF